MKPKIITKASSNLRLEFTQKFGGIGVTEIIFALIFTIIIFLQSLFFIRLMPNKIIASLIILFLDLILIATLIILLFPIPGTNEKVYQHLNKFIMFLFSKKNFVANEIKEFISITKIKNDYAFLANGKLFKLLKIEGLDLLLNTSEDQEEILSNITNFIKNIDDTMFLIKTEEKFNLNGQIEFVNQLMLFWNEQYYNKNITAKVFENIKKQLNNKIMLYEKIEKDNSFIKNTFYFAINGTSNKAIDNKINYTTHFLTKAKVNWSFALNKETTNVVLQLFKPLNMSQKNNFNKFIESLNQQKINIKRKYIKATNDYFAIKTIISYPAVVVNAWLADLAKIENINIVTKIINLSTNDALKLLEKGINRARFNQLDAKKISNYIDFDSYIASFSNLIEQIKNDGETVKLIKINLIVYADNLKKLSEINNKLLNKANQNGFVVNHNYNFQYQAFTDLFSEKTELTNEISCTSLAAAFPFIKNSINDDHGLLLGFSSTNNPCFLDLKTRDYQFRNSSSSFFVGTTGFGKTFNLSKQINHLFLNKTKMIIIDPERDYIGFSKYYGAKVIDCGNVDNGKINPLEPFTSDLSAHIRWFEEWFKILFPETTQFGISLLESLILEIYKNKNLLVTDENKNKNSEDYPTLQDLFLLANKKYNQSSNETERQLLASLMQLSTTGSYGSLWNGHSTLKIEKDRFIIFDMYNLRRNKQVINAQIYLMLSFLENEIIKNNNQNQILAENKKDWICIVIDEAHLLINKNNQFALNFISQLIKRIRKYQGMVLLATQNIKDFTGDPEIKKETEAIINNCTYQFAHGLTFTDLQDYETLQAKSNALSSKEQELLRTAKQGDCLIGIGNHKRIFIKIEANEIEQSAWNAKIE